MATAQRSHVIEVDWLAASPIGPVATGEAIAGYLELERPKTSNRAIFVRKNVAPRDAPIGADLVRIIIRQAYARAPGCLKRVRTCCVTRWPTAYSPAARH